ncbi:hypothetical protein SPRG_02885 [Saprolegnia parasitica CBS 223.65]|uniref:Palmitoyltransferase n=1 Tax=Saprolegnia parasitica (strain CBS 223.65) TaxID=695850 RepID=A0A067CPH2_SAPPC|nr:hypothetical protein SPRG_02885 [Saprolegnia parasitica CBS 223.65]KDO32408.1 hypothetical protein SPRG_02885 [Saprolegnia parasitica CBS 223.65]|eukprot:XP_012196862.1 hypothetical protein SPRG_02885 [Saprolegnia parasitica CBS 223.65]
MLDERKGRRRLHGLERPWHPRQVVVVCIFGLSVVCSGLSTALLVPEARGFCDLVVLASVDASIAVLFGIMVALFIAVSTADTLATKYPRSLYPGEKIARCRSCDVTVNSRTKHCLCCAKCVEGFDHHCDYLNTCIGTANVRQFRLLIAASIAYLIVQTALAIFTLLVTSASFGVQTLVALLAVLPAIGLVGLFVLAAFQAYIYRSGMTTFEFAVHMSRAKRKKQVVQQHPAAAHNKAMAPSVHLVKLSSSTSGPAPPLVLQFV